MAALTATWRPPADASRCAGPDGGGGVTHAKGRIDEVVEITSMGTVFPLVVQEAKLVRVPAVEQREVGAEVAGFDSVGRDRVGSMVKVGATERVVCDCGGVHSAGDVACDIAGVRSHEGLDPAHSPVFVPDQDSVDSKARSSSSERVVELDSSVVNADAEVLESMLVGCAGAAVAPVIGSIRGGDRKVKSVNSLVMALGSPA
ncbi:hypothetical protein V6N11_001571 [Hibiscus sabdariffa]|uniref:Uncharacterized protein n=1 Tax=Hibiscus sabdariffa TaxID=183260 RepID=A0ABR2S007_9ROSI